MIRKLNAVAVAALALVAAAGAQAQSSVSIYGVVDQALASVHNSVDAEKNNAAEDRLTGVEDGGMTSSYIGFSGTEDLGGGLKALFKLETYVKGDTGVTGTSNFWGRNSWLGLSGGFGSVMAGQAQTPLYNATVAFNPFGSSRLFSVSTRQYFGSYGDVAAVGQNKAWTNSLSYYTPGDLGGFNGALQYAFKEGADGSGSVGGSVGYAAGPLAAAVVFQQVKTGYATGRQNTWQLNGSYDLGVAKLFAQYGQVKDSSAAPYKDKIWQLGASVPVGSGAVMASYGEKQYKDTGAGDTYKDKNKTLSLGYDYALSKRTDVYAAYAYDRFSDNDTATAKFESTNSVGVGIRHRF